MDEAAKSPSRGCDLCFPRGRAGKDRSVGAREESDAEKIREKVCFNPLSYLAAKLAESAARSAPAAAKGSKNSFKPMGRRLLRPIGRQAVIALVRQSWNEARGARVRLRPR